MKPVLVTLAVVLFAGQALAQAPFSAATFEAACESAAKTNKVVLVDFYTTWCAPCKALDKSTWTDAKVRAWLTEKTVSIKIDAEKEVDLAARYRITAYPTILLLKADGTEVDRLIGFRPPELFLSEAGDALAGRDAVSRAKGKVATDPATDASARMDLGAALAQKGRYDEALAEFLWCFDHGLERDPAFAGVRVSFLLSYIKELGRVYPAAIEALEQRRGAAEAAVLAGTAKSDQVMDFAALSRELGDEARVLAAYDTLRAKGAAVAPSRAILFETAIDPLLAAGRYGDVIEGVGDVSARIDRDLQGFEEIKSRLPVKADPDLLDSYRQLIVDRAARLYQALVGAGRLDEAARAADKLIAFSATGETYASLIGAASRAGNPDVAKALVAKGNASLPEDERDAVREAERRIATKPAGR